MANELDYQMPYVIMFYRDFCPNFVRKNTNIRKYELVKESHSPQLIKHKINTKVLGGKINGKQMGIPF